MKGQPLAQFLHQQRNNTELTAELASLMVDVANVCKTISHRVNRGALADESAVAGAENVQGEVQQALDVSSNQHFIDALEWTGHLAGMVSEENEDVIHMPPQYPTGPYLICFDPLDGSSNIDVNLSVGSIFSILKCPDGVDNPAQEDFLQPGSQQVCAGFCIYGPSTILVLTTGQGVNEFTLDQGVGEFIVTDVNIRIPEDTAEFAINLSNRRFWESPIQRYVDECMAGIDGVRGKNFNMRWIASMVAEVYRILTRGGIFMYPFDFKDANMPGRLRLLYEANPMSFIVEQAGGAGSTGRERLLDLKPKVIHQRIPVILGSKNEVERVTSYHLHP